MLSPDGRRAAVESVTRQLDGGSLCLYDQRGVEMVRLPLPSPAFAVGDGMAEAGRIIPQQAVRSGVPVTYAAESADGTAVITGLVAEDLTLDRPLEVGGLVKVESLTYRQE